MRYKVRRLTYDAIISELYQSDELNECIRKFVPEQYRDDLKQEIFVILLDKPNELILSLYAEKKLTNYIARIIINLMRQSRNVFHQLYISKTVELTDKDVPCEASGELEVRRMKEQREDQALEKIEHMDECFNTPYYRLLVSAYKKHGSMREVSRQTGIPVKSISDSFKKIRRHVL